MRLLVAALVCCLPAVASAQSVDQCKTTPAPGGEAIVMQRVQCRLQIVDGERMQMADELTAYKADFSIAQGKVERLGEQVEKLQRKVRDAKDELSKAKKGKLGRVDVDAALAILEK